MRIEDIPEYKGNQYTERITVALTPEAYNALQALKKIKRRKPAELVRMLIDDFVTKNKEELKEIA